MEATKAKRQPRESVAWECQHCGKRHLWSWPEGDAHEADCRLWCELCLGFTEGKLFRIGVRAWAVAIGG